LKLKAETKLNCFCRKSRENSSLCLAGCKRINWKIDVVAVHVKPVSLEHRRLVGVVVVVVAVEVVTVVVIVVT